MSLANATIVTSLGSIVRRYPQHDNAIAAVVMLRDCYAPSSAEYKALDALAETINRLGGRVDTSTLYLADMPEQVALGCEAAAHHIREARR